MIYFTPCTNFELPRVRTETDLAGIRFLGVPRPVASIPTRTCIPRSFQVAVKLPGLSTAVLQQHASALVDDLPFLAGLADREYFVRRF
jgi:hypothetical protein